MLGFLSTAGSMAAISSVIYWTMNYRNKPLTPRELLKRVLNIMINYNLFYYAPTIARLLGQSMYSLIHGTPSYYDCAVHPLSTLEHYGDETKLIEYAMYYGPSAILPVGLMATDYMLSSIENMIFESEEDGKELKIKSTHGSDDGNKTKSLSVKTANRK